MIAPLSLVEARDEDSEFVWRTNSARDVREQSRDTSDIPREVHERWFTASLASESRRLYVAWLGEERVGVVRSDRRADGAYEMSIALSSSHRGRGLGRRVIHAMCAEMAGPEPMQIIATIRLDNRPSQRAFEAAGFHQRGAEDETWGTWVRQVDPISEPG